MRMYPDFEIEMEGTQRPTNIPAPREGGGKIEPDTRDRRFLYTHKARARNRSGVIQRNGIGLR